MSQLLISPEVITLFTQRNLPLFLNIKTSLLNSVFDFEDFGSNSLLFACCSGRC